MKKEFNEKNWQYDIICIGAGSGGLNVASFMAKAGFSVLLIDKKEKNIGGDCLNTGCVPSKALIKVSNLVYDAKQARKFGIVSSNKANMKKVTQYIKERQEIIRKDHDNSATLEKKGISVVFGEAKFTGKNAVSVGNKIYSAKKIVISTGSSPRTLNTPGIEKVKKIYTNESIFNINNLPENLLVIGGGPIGVELGQAFSRLGSEVTIIHRGPQFLEKEDPKISEILYKQLISEGINLHLSCEPIKFLSDKEVIVKSLKKGEIKFRFDAILLAIGRTLNIPEGLEKASVSLLSSEISKNPKIKVNDYLQTTNPNIFLCGDVAGMHQFTHAAELHASLIIKNFFSLFKKKLDNEKLSWVTYTDPEIASFGLSEKELKEKKIKYKKIEQSYSEVDRGIIDARSGFLILYISKKNTILGGTLVSPKAGEIFQELSLARDSKLNIKYLFNKIYPYPTSSRINKKAISQIFSEKLTPRTRKFLRFVFDFL